MEIRQQGLAVSRHPPCFLHHYLLNLQETTAIATDINSIMAVLSSHETTLSQYSAQHHSNRRSTRRRDHRNKHNYDDSESSSSSSLDDVLNTSSIGAVEPSDAAYVDAFLSPENTDEDGTATLDLSQVYLYSDRKFDTKHDSDDDVPESERFLITDHHVLRYRGDIVWQLLTTCNGDGEAMQGTCSSCRLTESTLRVRICHKRHHQQPHQRVGTSFDSNSFALASGGTTTTINTRNRYDLNLNDILLQSAIEYQSRALAT